MTVHYRNSDMLCCAAAAVSRRHGTDSFGALSPPPPARSSPKRTGFVGRIIISQLVSLFSFLFRHDIKFSSTAHIKGRRIFFSLSANKNKWRNFFRGLLGIPFSSNIEELGWLISRNRELVFHGLECATKNQLTNYLHMLQATEIRN